MYSSKLRVFTQLAFVAVLLFMLAAVPAAFADSMTKGGPVSQDTLPGQAAKPAAAAGPSQEMALAATTIVYDATSNPLPPNIPSLGFQATQTSEFGDYVHLAGTNRALRTVTVTMSDWALYSDYSSDVRYAGNSATWSHPITLNIYNVVPGTPLNTRGSLLGTVTQMVTIPWRPVADPTCTTPTAWRASDGNCYNGLAFNITFDMSSLNVTLPDDIIVGVAYNTANYGVAPIGANGPYDSLNVGALGSATIGTDDNTDRVFWNTSTAAWYHDGGTGGVGIFREDTNWTPNGTVNIQITAAPVVPSDVYVNPAWASVPPGQDPDGSGPASQMGYDAFTTIRAGVNAVASGGTVHVAAGTFPEDLVVAKSLTLACANVGIDPNTGTRGAETIIVPATEGSSTWGTIINLQASNVTIDGCMFDGDSSLLTGGYSMGGADINTNAAIDNGGVYDLDHLVVQNNIIQNFLYSSIYLDTTYGANHSSNYIVHNRFNNMWEGIQIYAAETDVSYNVFNDVTRGVSYHQVSAAADAGFIPQIANNTVNVVYNWTSTPRNVGIFVNGRQGSAVPFSIVGNTVNTPNATPSGKEYWGFTLWAVTGDRVVTFSGNTVNGGGNCDVGLWAWYIDSSNPVVLGGGGGGGLYNIKKTGVLLTNFHSAWGAGPTAITLSGLPITVSPGGTLVRAWEGATEPARVLLDLLRKGKSLLAPDRMALTANDTTLTITSGTYSGGAIGIDVDGATATVSGATISSNSTGVYIHNGGTGAFTNNCISANTSYGMNNTTGVTVDASPNWWGHATGPQHPTKNAGGLGDKVSDYIDFEPWISDTCHGATTTGNWQNTRTGAYDDLQDSLDNALAGDTIKAVGISPLVGGGVANVVGVTIDLNGKTVGRGSPFLTVNADDITVHGPGKIDGGGGGGAGILVQAGADNFILDGVQVTGWANGIELAGDVTSFKVVSNWIHTNSANGLLVDAGVDLGGVVTIEGNLFKVNTLKGIQHNGNGTLPAEYNSWGDIGGYTTGDGIGGSVDADPFTYVESFFDVWPDTLALERHVPENTSFNVALKADAVNLYGLTFKFTYDPAKLTFNSATFAGPWAASGRCFEWPYPNPVGVVSYVCQLYAGDTEWTTTPGTPGTIATFGFTALALPSDSPVTTYLDLSHLEIDTSAGAIGGQKVFVNNAGFNAPSVPARDITDTDDGRIIVERLANYTGFVDLQGRANDSGATVAVHATSAYGSLLLASATSASSGAYTTVHISPNWLAAGSTYWFQVDRALYLPTTAAGATLYDDSKVLSVVPLTTLSKVVLLGGDANNNNQIEVGDLSCIGGNYGGSGIVCGSTGWSDVNGDGLVNVQDLSMAGGNLYKTSSPWAP